MNRARDDNSTPGWTRDERCLSHSPGDETCRPVPSRNGERSPAAILRALALSWARDSAESISAFRYLRVWSGLPCAQLQPCWLVTGCLGSHSCGHAAQAQSRLDPSISSCRATILQHGTLYRDCRKKGGQSIRYCLSVYEEKSAHDDPASKGIVDRHAHSSIAVAGHGFISINEPSSESRQPCIVEE